MSVALSLENGLKWGFNPFPSSPSPVIQPSAVLVGIRVMGGKLKFQVQDSDLENLFWQCQKHIVLSEKRPPLIARSYMPVEICCNSSLSSFVCVSSFLMQRINTHKT